MSLRNIIVIIIAFSHFLSCAPTILPCSGGICGAVPKQDRAIYVAPELIASVMDIPVKGKTTVVDFWDLDCEPCIHAMPEWQKLWNRLDKDKAIIVGISLDEDIDDVRSAVSEGKIAVTFPMLYDGKALALNDIYEVGASRPVILVLNDMGIVIYDSRQSSEDYLETVERLLKQRGAL